MNKAQAKARAKALVAKMTVEEKVSQLAFHSPAIERLGIHEYNWWNEACHGVARAGTATVFPQSIGLAATFDPELVHTVADVISTEARAKYNKSARYGDFDIYKGLTYWTPNINIFRDPRWGRGQETYGEDPFLTATMGCAIVEGLQGDGEFYKSTACAKHFAVHSGPEKLRHQFNAEVSKKDLWETYLPAFERCVTKGKAAGVMGAYSAIDHTPCCVNNTLLLEILREQWGFDGYLVSDDHALNDVHGGHAYTKSAAETAALALKAGCDVDCGDVYRDHLLEAYHQDLITEEEITQAAEKVYEIRFLLGEFEETMPYSDIPFSVLDCEAHRKLNLKTAVQSVVMLKNDGILPLKDKKGQTVSVVGPNSMSIEVLEGNYEGKASEYVTVADGIRRAFENSRITVERGGHLYRYGKNICWELCNEVGEAVATAEESDVTVLCVGLDRSVEREEVYNWLNIPHEEQFEEISDGGDKTSLKLPPVQQRLVKEVCEANDNVIIVVMAGSCIDLGDEITAKARAILHAWYPGALGGLAIGRILSGEENPGGRLPVTFYSEQNVLPEIADYAMEGRTYRYLREAPRYPFGYGLSYGKVSYEQFSASRDGDGVTARVRLKNVGQRAVEEKVQIYAQYTDSRTATPNFQLCGVKTVTLAPGQSVETEIGIDGYWLKAVLSDGCRVTPDGGIRLFAGGHQPDERSCALTGTKCLELSL